MSENLVSWDEAGHLLSQGKVGVIPTDTVYGLVASIDDKLAVDRVYSIKGREYSKPCIVLISDFENLDLFGVSEQDKKRTVDYWPGAVSVVMDVEEKFRETPHISHLLRNGDSLAVRLPDHEELRGLLHHTGPIIAPSANPAGAKPATTITEAKHYFADQVDFYVDGGELENSPSKLIRLKGEQIEILRDR